MAERLTRVPNRSREFESQAGQVLHSVANGSSPLQHLRQVAVLPWRYDTEMGTANSLHASA